MSMPGHSPTPRGPIPRSESSTPYDNTVFARMRESLGPDGFLVPRQTPHAPKPDMSIDVPRPWQFRKRADRYLGVVAAAGEIILGETGAGLGTTESYRRSSFPHTQNQTVSTERAIHPDEFGGDGTWKQMFWKGVSEVTGPNADAPATRRERKAVRKMETARRDAAWSAGEAEVYKDEGTTAYAKRWGWYHDKRFKHKMRKAGRIADAKNIRGRIARKVAH